jgi:flagellar motor switch protein FliN/FliY
MTQPTNSQSSIQTAEDTSSTAEATTVRPVQFSALGSSSKMATPLGIPSFDILLDVPLRVTVELGRTRMPVKDVLALQHGSVIELDRMAGEPVDVLVNDRLIARGEVVVIEDRFGIRITETVTQRH